jgi:CheY-like chemotaxis protein/HPt (histidine-containing phosphotransfer) domain-containing protein
VQEVPKPRVLVADDNPLSLQFFCEALGSLGIDCIDAGDGVIALEHATREAFDLLLLDARMPGLDGAGALARIRARPGPSQGAIALATTADDDGSVHAALRTAGFVDVLAKPLDVAAIKGALERYLPAGCAHAADTVRRESLDERQALAAAGGDRSIVTALRDLLARELEALPAELAAITARLDAHSLRDRLHRLDASAGFCGAPALTHACSLLRTALDGPGWPEEAISRFLRTCRDVRALIGAPASADAGIGHAS